MSTFGQGDDDTVSQPDLPTKDLRFQHLTTEDGLSEGRVWGIIQDRRGFMWFTTWDGLNRYDGYEFKVYKQELGNPNSPGGEGFWDVYEDREGMIWAASHTGGGLSRFDPTTEQWRRYQHDPDDPDSLSSNNVYAIFEDSKGALWIGTEGGGLNRFEGETEAGVARFTRYPTNPDDPSGTSSDFVLTIYEDRSGELWFCTWGGLNRYDRETETFIRYQHNPDDPTSLSDNRVYTIYEDRFGVLWVGPHGGGLDRFDRDTETFTHYRHDPNDPHSMSGKIITSILEDKSGDLWIGTVDGGLNRLDRETNTFVSYQHGPSDTRSLGNNSVTALFEDLSGILWIGTAGSGVDRLDPFGQTFGLMRNNPTDSNSLSHNDIRSVLEDRTGDLWMGTLGGLVHYDPETETFTHYLHDPNNPNSLGNDRILSLLEDREGVLWIGLDSAGLNRLDRRTEDGDTPRFTRFEHDPADPQSLSDYDVTALYEDRAGILWVGTWTGGLNALDRQADDEHARFNRYQYDPEDPQSLGKGIVWAIHEDPEGVLWVGTAGGGLCRFDRESETFACYVHEQDDDHSLSSDTVWAIHQDGDGSLWLGTSAGLNRFSPQTGQFTHYTTADGLPHDTVVGILDEDTSQDDGTGALWLSTLGGLSRFDPQSGTFRNYDASDGLQGDIFNPAVSKTSSGMMLFGGQQGLTSFYPDDAQENPNIPPVHVTGLALSNEPVLIGDDSPLQQSIFETEKLELSYEDRVISFEFAALNYTSPEMNRYRYKLESFDEDWIEVGSERRFVTYTNLDPGEYVFRVLGSNSDGVWNEEGTSISITITPPWWGTWWFRGGGLLLLVGLVAGGFVWQRESARRRELQLEVKVAERTHELDERVKELDCLYGISRLARQEGLSLEQILIGAVDLLPPAMQYPEIAYARIVLDGQEFKTEDFRETPWQQSSAIVVQGEQAGRVEVGYLEERPEVDEGPFQKEERLLLNAVAERLGRIIEKKQAEVALRESEEAYRNLVEKVSDVIYSVDTQGVITYLNPAIESLIGLTPEQVVGQPFAQFVNADDLERLQDNIQSLLSGVTPDSNEYRVLTASGEIRWIHVTSQPIRDGDKVTGVQGVLTDITERKKVEGQLEQAATAAERQRLARELHDSVTQTLYSIDLFSNATQQALSSGKIDTATEHARQVRDLSQSALADMRLLIFELQPPILEKEGLVSALRKRLELVESRAGLDTKFEVNAERPLPSSVEGDLYAIATEALNNTLKHAQAEHITINLEYNDQYTYLTISDDGCGFDSQLAEKSHGYGLRNIRERVERMDGSMTLDTSPGRGTTVSVKVSA